MGFRYATGRLYKPRVWWLSGGISAGNCIAAYQSKGAADYTNSLINLANPGTYNASADPNAPDWDITNGWKFASASSHGLSCGFSVPSTTAAVSAIVRFSNATSGTNGAIYGQLNQYGGTAFGYSPFMSTVKHSNGGKLNATAIASGGIEAIAGQAAYEDGAYYGAIPTATVAVYSTLHIGCWRYDGGIVIINSAYVQAFAYYNTVITAAQVSALTTAMNAL